MKSKGYSNIGGGWGGKGQIRCIMGSEHEFRRCFADELDLAPVVKTLDCAIHRINHYPADKYLGN